MTQISEQDQFTHLLEQSATYHAHLCPRQVMGVRLGLYAGQVLGLEVPQADKRLFTFIETDGCFLDGVAVSTGCSVGRRTMKVLDFGKMAATCVNILTGQAIRISPRPDARILCPEYAPQAADRWHAYLYGYQVMPVEKLFILEPVQLTVSLKALLSRKNARAVCEKCGEEIFKEREVQVDGIVLCRSCAGQSYYAPSDLVFDTLLPQIKENFIHTFH
jgi:formylmethanofuran dehydrogenase subunit E